MYHTFILFSLLFLHRLKRREDKRKKKSSPKNYMKNKRFMKPSSKRYIHLFTPTALN